MSLLNINTMTKNNNEYTAYLLANYFQLIGYFCLNIDIIKYTLIV